MSYFVTQLQLLTQLCDTEIEEIMMGTFTYNLDIGTLKLKKRGKKGRQ